MLRKCLSLYVLRGGWICGIAFLLAANWALASETLPASGAPALHAHRIAVFGSSVASGAVDEAHQGGYAGRLGQYLAPRGWEVVNVSRGGDNTRTIAPRFEKDLLPQQASYAIIGLSLANEGIARQPDTAYRDGIYEQWRSGVQALMRRCQEAGMKPIVGNCYAKDLCATDPGIYEYTRRMNVEIGCWETPSINFLGAIDDGSGVWVNGYFADGGHPNAAGHQEMMLAIVPSLFAAIEAGKPAPVKAPGNLFAHATAQTAAAPLCFTPEDPMHAFAISFWARPLIPGIIAAVSGNIMDANNAANPCEVSIAYQDNAIIYTGAASTSIQAPFSPSANWHHIVLSHGYARGITGLYVDGILAGSVQERIQPSSFHLGGGAKAVPSAESDLRDWMVYRSALTLDEVQCLFQGRMFASSLEIYAPLADKAFTPGQPIENRAQSLSRAITNGPGLSTRAE